MDKLISLINARRADLANARDAYERVGQELSALADKYLNAEAYVRELEIELRALQQADELRPLGLETTTAPEPQPEHQLIAELPRRGGRQKGAISLKWREALSDLVAAGNQPVSPERFYLLTRARLGLAESSARDRFPLRAAKARRPTRIGQVFDARQISGSFEQRTKVRLTGRTKHHGR